MRRILGICIVCTLFIFTACSTKNGEGKNNKRIKIGVTMSPHGEILNNIKKIFDLDYEVINYINYETLNEDLLLGKIDANFFQTRDYLDNFNKNSDTKLVELALVHIEPLIIYSNEYRSIENVRQGDVVYIPNDTVNRSRALELLQDAGLIKISLDLNQENYIVVENNKDLVINEVVSVLLPSFYEQSDLIIMNTNIALESGIFPYVAGIFYEKTFTEDDGKVNVFVTTESMKTSVELKQVAQGLNSYETFKFINEKYRGFVKPIF